MHPSRPGLTHAHMDRDGATRWTLEELHAEFDRYSSRIHSSDLAPSSKTTYLHHADRFVRWLGGEVDIARGNLLSE